MPRISGTGQNRNRGIEFQNNRNPRDIYINKLFMAVRTNDILQVNEILTSMYVLKLSDGIDAVNEINKTPLIIACENGNLDIVKALVKAGADINAVDIYNLSPLGYAATYGHSEIVVYLCEFDINPNIVRIGKFADETPLMYAAWKCNKEAVEALIKKGADVNAYKQSDNFTPVIYALYNINGKEEVEQIIDLLLENGASAINFTNKFIKALFSNVKDNDITNLNINLERIRMLRLVGLVNQIESEHNRTVLHLACENGNLDIVKALVKAGADVNAVDIYNLSPLGYAATYGHSEIVIYLCEFDINPNIVRIGELPDETPLMYAAWKCNKEAVEALIKKGADVNAYKQSDNFTPAIYAIYNTNGKQEANTIISLLVKNGANIDTLFKRKYRAQHREEYKPPTNTPTSKSRKTRKSRKSKSRKSRKSKSRKSR
jgi:ankyrin repeat-rich membrane spanning protein